MLCGLGTVKLLERAKEENGSPILLFVCFTTLHACLLCASTHF
jgi:hypothetical protein